MDSSKNAHFQAISAAKREKNYEAMIVAAQAALKAFPSEKHFETLLHEAQAYYVDEKLHSDVVHGLEEKKDWKSLAAVYQKLLTVFPESPDLHELLEKIRNKLEHAGQREMALYYQNAEAQIRKMMEESRLDEAEQACYELLAHDLHHRGAQHLLAHVQARIDREMDEAMTLFYKTHYRDLKMEYKKNREQFVRV